MSFLFQTRKKTTLNLSRSQPQVNLNDILIAMTVLKVTLGGSAVNKLYDSLATLAKMGEYVSLDARRTKLTFSVFNSTMSAYGSMELLGGKFFDAYQFVPDQQPGVRAEEAKFSCKFLAKALIPVFRSRSQDWKEKDTGIEKCEMSVQDRPNKSQCRLIIKLHCKHGVIKTFRLQYEELEAMHANFDKRNPANVRNRWRLNSRLLKEHMDHFGPKAENLDIFAEGGRVSLCSFTEKVADGREVLKHPVQTSVELDSVEFEEFKVEEGLHVVVNVKDFRAMAIHAELLNVGIQVLYGDPGNPMHVSYDKDGLATEFVFMTRRKGETGLVAGTKVTVGVSAPSTVPSTQVSQRGQAQLTPRGSISGSISMASSRMGSFHAPTFAGDMPPPPLPRDSNASLVKNTAPTAEKEKGNNDRRARDPSPPIRRSQTLFLMDDDDLFGTGQGDDKDSEEEEENEDVIGWDANMTISRDSFGSGIGGGRVRIQGTREGNADAVPPTQQERVRGLFGD